MIIETVSEPANRWRHGRRGDAVGAAEHVGDDLPGARRVHGLEGLQNRRVAVVVDARDEVDLGRQRPQHVGRRGDGVGEGLLGHVPLADARRARRDARADRRLLRVDLRGIQIFNPTSM